MRHQGSNMSHQRSNIAHQGSNMSFQSSNREALRLSQCSLGGFGQNFDRNDRSCAAITVALTIKLCGKRLPLRMGGFGATRTFARPCTRARRILFRGWKATEVAGPKKADFYQPGVPVLQNRRFPRRRTFAEGAPSGLTEPE